MRKAMVLLVAMIVFVAFTVAPMAAMACGGNKTSADHSTSSNKMVSAKTACTGTATQTSAGQACPPGCIGACAEKLGMTPEDCAKLCAEGQYSLVSMSVKGMVCGGCEQTVTACLSEVPGVVKVGKVDYKTGTAYVLVDPVKAKNESLVKAVSAKGYEAEVIPAVAVTPASGEEGATMGTAHCTGAHAACTGMHKSCTGTKSAEKKAEKKTDGSM